MRTISAEIITFLNSSGSEPIWYLEITKSGGVTDPDGSTSEWPSLGADDFGVDSRIFATGYPTWTDATSRASSYQLSYDRLNLKSINDIVASIHGADRKAGGLSSLDSTSIRIDNTDGAFTADTAAGFIGVNFNGCVAKFYLSFDGIDDKDLDLLIFTGLVNDHRFDKDDYILEIDSLQLGLKKKAPDNFFQIAEGDNSIAEQTRAIPAVFGRHDMVPGFIQSDITEAGSSDLGRTIKFCDVKNKTACYDMLAVRIGDPGLTNVSSGFSDLTTTAPPNLVGTTPYTMTKASGIAVLTNTADDEVYFNLLIKPTGALKQTAGHDGTNNPDNAIDGDITTTSTAAQDATYDDKVWGFKLPNMTSEAIIEKIASGGYTGVYLIHKIQTILSSGYLFMYLGPYDELNGLGFPKAALMTPADNGTYNTYDPVDPQADFQIIEMTDATWDEFATLSKLGGKFLKYDLYSEATTGGVMAIYETMLAVYCHQKLDAESLYADMSGYIDGSVGEISGRPNGCIYEPAAIICYLYHYFGGVALADMDITGALKISSLYRSTWSFAKALTTSRDIGESVQEIALQAGIWVWFDEAGKLKITAWNQDPSGDSIPIIISDVKEGELDSAGISRIEDIVTDFTLKYKYNPIRNEFDKILKSDPTDSRIEWAIFDNGGYTKSETYEFDWIRDDDTAALVLEWLIDYHTTRKWEIVFTSDLKLLKLQIGDQIHLNETDPWPVSVPLGARDAEYRITKAIVKPKSDTIQITAVEVFSV